MGERPAIALGTPAGLLSVDELDFAFSILGWWSALACSSTTGSITTWVVPLRLVARAIASGSIATFVLWAVTGPVVGISTEVTVSFSFGAWLSVAILVVDCLHDVPNIDRAATR